METIDFYKAENHKNLKWKDEFDECVNSDHEHSLALGAASFLAGVIALMFCSKQTPEMKEAILEFNKKEEEYKLQIKNSEETLVQSKQTNKVLEQQLVENNKKMHDNEKLTEKI